MTSLFEQSSFIYGHEDDQPRGYPFWKEGLYSVFKERSNNKKRFEN